MDNLIEVVTYFLAVSVAVERLVEICKNTFLKDKVSNGAVWQIMGLIFGAGIGYFQPVPLSSSFPLWLNVLITGAIASGGSSFWNSILETLTSLRNQSVRNHLNIFVLKFQINWREANIIRLSIFNFLGKE